MGEVIQEISLINSVGENLERSGDKNLETNTKKIKEQVEKLRKLVIGKYEESPSDSNINSSNTNAKNNANNDQKSHDAVMKSSDSDASSQVGKLSGENATKNKDDVEIL